MDPAQHGRIVSFIWNVADDVLRDVYVRGRYRDIILTMTVLRRIDALLEDTKAQVLDRVAKLRDKKFSDEQIETVLITSKVSGHPFVNTSPFTLRSLRDHPSQLRPNFEAYLAGFSRNVREIIQRFGFVTQLDKLEKKQLLDPLLERFTSREINFSPRPVVDDKGALRLPGLSNHDMGYVFEELLRRFNEDNNEEAGEHFTPREVVRLMASLLFEPVADRITDSTYLVYDCACGSGGMLTEADAMLRDLARREDKRVQIRLYGQEVNDETWAICKADMLIKGEDEPNIRPGSTLSEDAFATTRFDFMLANPPFGKSWKTDLDRIGGKGEVTDARFTVRFADGTAGSVVTRTSDGQLMFLANMLAKMKDDTALGSRVATVHNGSSLFSGDAGAGESNLRRHVIEGDLLEAIIALPLRLFYNTGIATYVWVLANRKAARRRGKVQLIDATAWSRPLRKNLGQKSVELAPEDIQRVVTTFLDFKETEHSKIFDNAHFGHWEVTVERPLRLRVEGSPERLRRLSSACADANDGALYALVNAAFQRLGVRATRDYNTFAEALDAEAAARKEKVSDKRRRLVRAAITTRDPEAEPVVSRVAEGKKAVAAPLRGRFAVKRKGANAVVEYEPDPELRETEQVPLMEEGGVEALLTREVLPYAADAWEDASARRVGYKVNFNKHFYTPQAMRSPEEIRAEIVQVHAESEGLLAAILGRSVT